MEAGNRCFDQRVPEDLNRKVQDHLSDLNIVLTDHAHRYLLTEGIPRDRIIKSGSHMREVLNHFMPEIQKSNALCELEVQSQRYFVVGTHREGNVDTPANLQDWLNTLQALVKQYDMPAIVSTRPRTRERLEKLKTQGIDARIRFLKPLCFFDYIKLRMDAFCILSDSGTITEEASLLNLPAITARNAHERPEGMDGGTSIMSGLKEPRVLDAVQVVTRQHKFWGHPHKLAQNYNGGLVSQKIVRIVLSYIDLVNRTVWCK